VVEAADASAAAGDDTTKPADERVSLAEEPEEPAAASPAADEDEDEEGSLPRADALLAAILRALGEPQGEPPGTEPLPAPRPLEELGAEADDEDEEVEEADEEAESRESVLAAAFARVAALDAKYGADGHAGYEPGLFSGEWGWEEDDEAPRVPEVLEPDFAAELHAGEDPELEELFRRFGASHHHQAFAAPADGPADDLEDAEAEAETYVGDEREDGPRLEEYRSLLSQLNELHRLYGDLEHVQAELHAMGGQDVQWAGEALPEDGMDELWEQASTWPAPSEPEEKALPADDTVVLGGGSGYSALDTLD
jgi:hypothetical protein